MSNQFDQLLQTNVLILSKFSLELGEKKTALIFESAELATSLENWERLIEIFSVSDEDTKEKVIEDFWERIPFPILNKYKIYVKENKSKSFALYSLWKNKSLQREIVPPEWEGNYLILIFFAKRLNNF